MAKHITSITGYFSGIVTHSNNTNHPFDGSIDIRGNRRTNERRQTGEDAMADADVVSDFVPLVPLTGAGGTVNTLVSDVVCNVNAKVSFSDGSHGEFAVVYEFGEARFVGSTEVQTLLAIDTTGALDAYNQMLTDAAGVTI